MAKLDEINRSYFEILRKKRKKNSTSLQIGKNFFPTAIAPPELLKELPWISYSQLQNKSEHFKRAAQECTLWLKKTQAGGGTSIKREKYLLSISKRKTLGSKGTDLFIEIEKGHLASIAEVQVIQASNLSREKKVKHVIFSDLVSEESQGAVKALWKMQKFKNLNKSEFFSKGPTLLQRLLPTLNEKGKFSRNRLAPGGHGFFAYETLLSLSKDKSRKAKGPLISVIGNGEDLASTPNENVLGWMIENEVPLVMLTTEKTPTDLKGGQISLVKEKEELYVSIVERAQAEQSGQLDYFEKIGLEIRERNQPAFFNTNVALFNHGVLAERLQRLRKKIGIQKFKNAIAPTLIENKKMQKDKDGKTRPYIQLEGAMASCLLNLDRAWRRHFNEPLVHFINFEKEYRTEIFCPIKTAFDFFMLYHSDRFTFDSEHFRLRDNNPGTLPLIELPQEFYQDVDNDLESLKVEGGPVDFSGLTLQGHITIHNEFEETKGFNSLKEGTK
jgi:UDP-N-acetylglucosamine pyrophosphorylase